MLGGAEGAWRNLGMVRARNPPSSSDSSVHARRGTRTPRDWTRVLKDSYARTAKDTRLEASEGGLEGGCEGAGEASVDGGGSDPLDLLLATPVLLLDPMLLCSGEARAIFFRSRLTGSVWRSPRRAAEPRKPGADRGTVDSLMV